MAKKSILFVCLGNICRSPLAEGVFRSVLAERGMADDFLINSAGMGDWHAGQAPDHRSIAIARTNGLDISGQRARMIRQEDFRRFDLILGMDRKNIAELLEIAPAAFRDRIHLFLDSPARGVRSLFGERGSQRMIRVASGGACREARLAAHVGAGQRPGLLDDIGPAADRIARRHQHEAADLKGAVEKLPRADRYFATSAGLELRSRASVTCGVNLRASAAMPSRWQMRSISPCSALRSGEAMAPA